MRKAWHAYVLIAPLVAGCLLFTVVPFVLVLQYSFMRGSGGSAQFLGLENYIKIIANEEFMLAFGNSMKFLLMVDETNLIGCLFFDANTNRITGYSLDPQLVSLSMGAVRSW